MNNTALQEEDLAVIRSSISQFIMLGVVNREEHFSHAAADQ